MWHPSIWEPSKEVCIYRVPKSIMICKREAYIPSVVSLGPYHNKKNRTLPPMDQDKVEAVNRMSKLFKTDETIMIAKIQELDKNIRACYAEPIEWDEKTLSLILTRDGCFILAFFSFFLVRERANQENTVHLEILNDIIKLENQIPFIILKALLELRYKTNEVTSFLSGALPFRMFNGFPFNCPSSSVKLMEYINKDPRHLLDLQRIIIKDLLTDGINTHHRQREWSIRVALPGSADSFPTRSHKKSSLSAELLDKVGIKFKQGQIGFENSTFSLPQIIMDDSTETVLRNLMAYEECQRCSWSPQETVISHFVCFLDNLIDSEKDVSILKKAGIIQSCLGSEKEVADIINHLGKGITVDADKRYQFQEAAEQARRYYYREEKNRIRLAKEEHCSKPCYWVPILAGLAMLLMTAIQVWCAINNG